MPADYDKHDDDELREGVRKGAEQEDRLEETGSEQQLSAERDQRHAMEEELERRDS